MKAIDSIAETLLNAKTKEDMINLLKGLLTEKERDEFAQRINIVKMLKTGVPHQTIAQKLGVGVATVTRGSKEIKKGNFKTIE